MALRVAFTFDTEGMLSSASLARLHCDLQHLALIVLAPEIQDAGLPGVAYALRIPKYSIFIEMQPGDFGLAEAYVSGLRFQSPLWIEILLKIPKELYGRVTTSFGIMRDRLLLPELEERRKQAQVSRLEIENEGALIANDAARIANLAAQIDALRKFDDPKLLELFKRSIASSLHPFEVEHPPIKQIETRIDDEDAENEDMQDASGDSPQEPPSPKA
jgi:hypothetical protein